MAGLNLMKGLSFLADGSALFKMMLGLTKTEFLDSSSGDATPSTIENCRMISCDSDGIIKFDYQTEDGESCTEVKQVLAGTMYPYRNVSKVYRYYVSTTPCTAKAYTAAGVLTVGLKIHR